MSAPFIANRHSLEDATRLIELHGAAAEMKAALLAEGMRRNDNVRGFCHWRQIERVIAALGAGADGATRH